MLRALSAHSSSLKEEVEAVGNAMEAASMALR